MGLFKKQVSQVSYPQPQYQNNLQRPKPKVENDCEIKVKRDKSGQVIGVTKKGNCTKADVDIFKSGAGLETDSD